MLVFGSSFRFSTIVTWFALSTARLYCGSIEMVEFIRNFSTCYALASPFHAPFIVRGRPLGTALFGAILLLALPFCIAGQ